MEERRPDTNTEIRDVLAGCVLKKELTYDPRLRSGGLGAAFRQGLFDSPEAAFRNKVSVFIKVCLGVPVQNEGTLVDIEGYADMDGGWSESGHSQRDEKQYQRGRQSNDNNLVEPTLPLKPPPPFLQPRHTPSLVENLDRLVCQSPHVMTQTSLRMFRRLNRLDPKLLMTRPTYDRFENFNSLLIRKRHGERQRFAWSHGEIAGESPAGAGEVPDRAMALEWPVVIGDSALHGEAAEGTKYEGHESLSG